ncbi:LOW QUALITY PROTEIN: C-C motif chemokine 4 homolog [Tympanuchus pallidicinctus]|uniref:LOW QUALITY PROTEIN: C-C motif chemokine 4 homolog n=1 Tax=Tympanuchus pallidicinctus TaxID=109042 RepID=UPI002286F734|nr:LOW QUALITY PROTEIN: C-C motif chemokine 4 homolog [Tympanuchus pallidicinctus]
MSHSTMKGSAAALAGLLLALCSSTVDCFPIGSSDDIPLSCCYSYVSRPIPYKLIASVYATSSSCSLPAVIVVTKKKRKICTDPKQFWVQALLELSRTEKLLSHAVKEVKTQR